VSKNGYGKKLSANVRCGGSRGARGFSKGLAELRAGNEDQRSNKGVHLFEAFAVERALPEQHVSEKGKTGETMHSDFYSVNSEGRWIGIFFQRVRETEACVPIPNSLLPNFVGNFPTWAPGNGVGAGSRVV